MDYKSRNPYTHVRSPVQHMFVLDANVCLLLYDWREPCLLIGTICLRKFLCLPERGNVLMNSLRKRQFKVENVGICYQTPTTGKLKIKVTISKMRSHERLRF